MDVDMKTEQTKDENDVTHTKCRPLLNKSIFSVNRKFLPIKILYFVMCAALGCHLPFVFIFAKQLGLTSQESGTLFGVMPFLSFLAQIIIAMLADRWRKHKVILMLAFLIAGVFNVLIVAVPPRLQRHGLRGNVVVNCHADQLSSLTYCEPHPPSVIFVADAHDGSGAVESLGALPLQSPNVSSTQLEGVSSGVANMSEYSCPPTMFQILNTMSIVKEWTCLASCPNPPHSTNGKTCMSNQTDSNTLSNGMSGGCSGTEYQRFPESVYIHSLIKVSIASDSTDDRNDTIPLDKRCSKFHLSSLQVDESHLFKAIHCEPERELQCTLECDIPADKACPTNVSSFDLTFWLVLILHMIGGLTVAPVLSMTDAACYSILKDQWHLYGQQRVWGTIGWLVVATATSAGVYLNTDLNYSLLFYAHGALMGLSIVITYFVNIPSDIHCGNIFKNMRKVLMLPKVMALLLMALVFGAMFGATGFVLWYLEDLGAPPQIFGPYYVVSVLTEIPIFFLAGRLIRRFGPIPCLCVGVAAMSVRLTGYALLGDPWLALLFVVLHGAAYGLFMSSASIYITWVTPHSMSATAQGLLGGCMVNLGRGTGVILTGWMMAAVGPRITFAVYAATGLVACVLYALLHRCVFRDQSQPARDQEDTAEDGQVSDVDTQLPVEETDEKTRVDQQTLTDTLLPSVSPHPADDDNTLLPSVSPHPAADDNCHNTLLPSVSPHPAADDSCSHPLMSTNGDTNTV